MAHRSDPHVWLVVDGIKGDSIDPKNVPTLSGRKLTVGKRCASGMTMRAIRIAAH
jgi:hypothetical protein